MIVYPKEMTPEYAEYLIERARIIHDMDVDFIARFNEYNLATRISFIAWLEGYGFTITCETTRKTTP